MTGRFLALVLIYSTCTHGESEVKPSDTSETGRTGETLFADDFSRTELGDRWRIHPNSFSINDGVLIGAQQPGTDHGAVSKVTVPFKDAVIGFSFKLAGSPRFNVVIDERGFKDSHAGHICRVSVTQHSVLLQDDKTGPMHKDVFERRRKSKNDPEIRTRLKGKSKSVKTRIVDGKWYRMTIKIRDDEMTVSLDDKEVGRLKSEGIGHETKTEFGFTVIDQAVHFDNLRIARPTE